MEPLLAETPEGALHGVVELSHGQFQPTLIRTLQGRVFISLHPSRITADVAATSPDAGWYFTPLEINGCATQISAGGFGCARMSDGTARCFGPSNDGGHLGSGSYALPPNGLSDVSGLTGVTEIRTQWNHTCARFDDGGFRCWGDNTWGQLGDGTYISRPAP